MSDSRTPQSADAYTMALDALKYALNIADAEGWNTGIDQIPDGDPRSSIGLIAYRKMLAAIAALETPLGTVEQSIPLPVADGRWWLWDGQKWEHATPGLAAQSATVASKVYECSHPGCACEEGRCLADESNLWEHNRHAEHCDYCSVIAPPDSGAQP
jgi:hypothetical protein